MRHQCLDSIETNRQLYSFVDCVKPPRCQSGAVVVAITLLGIHPLGIKSVQELFTVFFCVPGTSHPGRAIDGVVVLRLFLAIRTEMSTAINMLHHHANYTAISTHNE